MNPRRAHSETRSSIRSRRRRFAGCSLVMGGRALYGADGAFARCRSREHAVEEALAAQLDADMEALEAAHQRARLFERERAIERTQRAEVHRHEPGATHPARTADRTAVGDVEADRLLAGELA